MAQLLQVLLLFFIGISFSQVSSEYEDRIINESEEFNSVFSPSPFHSCSNDSYPPTFQQHIQEYVIDLDKPPEERWVQLVTDKKEELKNLFWMMQNNTAGIFGGEIIKLVNTYLPWLTNTLPKEYYNELIGISSASGIPVGEVTMFNIFYEFYSACTSIIMQSSDNHIYLGRNLDFGLLLGWDFKNRTWMATEYLRPLVVKTTFKKENRTIYKSVGFVGYIGVLTAVKKDAFALTVNERFNLEGGYIGLLEWIFGRRNQRWIGLLTRDVLENSENYLQAQKLLSSPTLIAPVYFILAGRKSHQGCIITRGRRDYDVWSLENYNDKNIWFLVQTNYDHWETPPFFDDRRDPANKCMEQFGPDNPESTLYKVLSTRPVLNKLTTFTAIMDVTTGDLQAWIRNCKSPCWPW